VTTVGSWELNTSAGMEPVDAVVDDEA
jgi:hypothetical protein